MSVSITRAHKVESYLESAHENVFFFHVFKRWTLQEESFYRKGNLCSIMEHIMPFKLTQLKKKYEEDKRRVSSNESKLVSNISTTIL